MDDDINSSGALAVIFDLARPLRALANRLERGDKAMREETDQLSPRWQLLVELANVLGLQAEASPTNDSQTKKGTDETSIQNAIAARKEAKAARDFAKADQIRDDLKALGIELIDKPGGITEWISN